MKFSKHLASHMTPEWRSQYIDYGIMEKMISNAAEQAPKIEHIVASEVENYYEMFEIKFFEFCDSELKKVEAFYSQKLAEATRTYSSLKDDLSELQRNVKKQRKRDENAPTKISDKKMHQMQLAYSEFYLNLILLQRYQTLNNNGFVNILTHYDEKLKRKTGKKWLRKHVDQSHFHTNNDVNRLIAETEQTVIYRLEGGDKQRAMKKLRVPRFSEKNLPLVALKVGLFTGALLILLSALVILAIIFADRLDWAMTSYMYRSPLVIILFLWFWGLNIHSWRKAGINHVLIFELDPRDHVEALHVLEIASVFAVLWTLSLIFFIYCPLIGIFPRYVSPLILYILMIGYLVNPTKTFRPQARFWTLCKLYRLVTAPMLFVYFPDFWLGDQMCSLAIIYADLANVLCFFSTNKNWNSFEDAAYCEHTLGPYNALFMALPYYFRFMQCIRRYVNSKLINPHIVNAMKYFSCLFANFCTFLHLFFNSSYDHSVYNPFFYIRVISMIVASTYCLYWDYSQDWGVLHTNVDNWFLRDEIVFPQSWYYFAIIENFVVRYFGISVLFLLESGRGNATTATNILVVSEAFRRFVWNFFRLENEHLNNCGLFRAVRDIHIRPIDLKDRKKIIKMMDNENGVINKRKKLYEDTAVPVSSYAQVSLILGYDDDKPTKKK